MDVDASIRSLDHFVCLCREHIKAFICSSQTLRDGMRLAIAQEVRELVFDFATNVVDFAAYVHSTHTKHNWYRVRIKVEQNLIKDGTCPCGGRSVHDFPQKLAPLFSNLIFFLVRIVISLFIASIKQLYFGLFVFCGIIGIKCRRSPAFSAE